MSDVDKADIRALEGELSIANAKNLLKETEAGLSIAEIILKDDATHRRKVSDYIVKSFISINVSILIIVLIIFSADCYFIVTLGKDYVRIVDARTLMTLIGATTVQFGAMALAVSSWLFPKNQK